MNRLLGFINWGKKQPQKLFALCFGDKSQALALKKRFDEFFPKFKYVYTPKSRPKSTKDYVLLLQSKNHPSIYATPKS